MGAAQRRGRYHDGRGAALVTGRQIFVIRQQRIVRAKELARVGRVMDAGEEVGVIADYGRKRELALRGAVKEPRAQRFDPGALAAEREQRIERCAGGTLSGAGGQAFEQAEFEPRGKIEDLIPDGDATAGGATRHAKYADRQVLDRKVGVPVGGGDPTAPRG